MSIHTDPDIIETGTIEPRSQAFDGVTVSSEPPPAAPRRPVVRRASERVRDLVDAVWAQRFVGPAVGIGAAAVWGLAAGWWTPRGPLTSGEAIWSIVLSLAVGATAGLALRSRWTMLATPATFAVVFELARLGTEGPTVDGIHTSMYGLIAFVVGRGFHAFLSLIPMTLGAAIGAGAARMMTRTPTSGRSGARYVRRSVAVLTALAMVALTAGLARPARTAPIVDANGEEIAGSVAELSTVNINGHDLHMMIRGHSVDKPVLLFLAGGPGGSEIGSMRRHLPGLEEYFTVVTLDQRGSGTSYPALDPIDTLTVQGSIDDTVAVTDHLRGRFGQDRVYLMGQSWGSILGVLTVQQRPDLYRAFIGTGQMVSPVETDRIFYRDALTWATVNGKTDLEADLIAIGEPPYDEMLNYETALSNEQTVYAYDHSPNSEGQGQMSENLLVGEYTLIDQVHILGAFMDTFSVLYPQLSEIDFRTTATSLDVPVFFAQGAHEAPGRAVLFDEWYPMLDAPAKELTVLSTSGHRPLFEQPDEFVAFMVDTVLAGTN